MDETAQTSVPRGRKKVAVIVFTLLTIIGIAAVFFYLRHKSTHISTDDAFIEGNIHTIASKVPGTVRAVHVDSNQEVKKGDLLVEIDEADYDARVSEAGAALDSERLKEAELRARIEVARRQLAETNFRLQAAKANLELQDANLRQAVVDMRRAENLFTKEAITKEKFERVKTAYDVALAQVKAARDQESQAGASVETQKAAIRQAESSLSAQGAVIRQRASVLRVVELNREYTKIYAPVDGNITKKSVEVGNQVQPGQPLMAVVRLDEIHVIANYKETQLEKIKHGQKVEIRVDTYPGKVFNGRVDSIMAGTGAAFSLFPPENATGNFVKVVQRVPVKIVFDRNADQEHVLRLGMSVEPTVILEK